MNIKVKQEAAKYKHIEEPFSFLFKIVGGFCLFIWYT